MGWWVVGGYMGEVGTVEQREVAEGSVRVLIFSHLVRVSSVLWVFQAAVR